MKRAIAAWRGPGLRLFRDLAVLVTGQVANKIIAFVAFAYLARVIDPVAYGGLEYVVSLGILFAFVVDGGLGAIGVRRVAKDRADLPTLAFQIPIARMLIATAAVPVMILIASSAMASAAPPQLIWLYALSLLAMPWRQEWLLQASERMTEAAFALVIRSSIFCLGVFLLVKNTGDLARAGWAEIASVAAMVLFCVVIQHRKVTPFSLKGSMAGFFPMMKEGVAISSTNMVWALNQAIPLILIGSLVGGIEVALFASAARLIGSLLTFSNLYHFNLFPAVTRAKAADTAEMSVLMKRSFRVVSWAGVLVALVLALFAEPIVRLAFGEKLVGAAPLLAIMAAGLPIALWSGHSRWGLVASGEQGKVLIAHLIGFAAIVISCPVLGYLMGAPGYAIGATAGPVSIWISSHLFAARHGNAPPSFWLTARPIVTAAVVAGVCIYFGLGFWQRAAGVAAFCLIAPLIDRKAIPDLIKLGRAKMSGG